MQRIRFPSITGRYYYSHRGMIMKYRVTGRNFKATKMGLMSPKIDEIFEAKDQTDAWFQFKKKYEGCNAISVKPVEG